jgi:cell division protein FtsQ
MPSVPWRPIAAVAAGVALLAGVYSATLWLMDRPFDTIVASGPFERVPVVQVEAAVADHIGSGFLSADLDDVRDALEVLPWVAKASVRRRWPNTLQIGIEEQVAAACWRETGLVNRQGRLFVADARHVPAELPRLAGPAGTEVQVTKQFFLIQASLEQRGLTAAALDLDSRGSWRLTLGNGLDVRFGSQDIDLRIQRFLNALDVLLTGAADDMKYIDMRYTNGFAVGWRNPARIATRLTGSKNQGV